MLGIYGLKIFKMKKILTRLLFISIAIPNFAQDADDPFEIYNVRTEDGTTIVYAKNNFLCDESVYIEFTALKNMEADVKLPFEGVVPADTKDFKLLTLTIKKPSQGSQLGYISSYCHGDIYGKHNDSYLYTIPYKEGERYPIGQAYGGKKSHFMKGETYAIDFTMPEGSSVCAAREGIVIFVKDDSDKGGKTAKYKSFGNYVTIYHRDGTMADYFHLKKNGSKVKVGDEVLAGQEIALSGNTGITTGAHLHFQTYKFNEDMEYESIPTTFKLEDGKTGILKVSDKGYVSVR